MELHAMSVPNWTGVVLFYSGQMYTQEVTWPPGQQFSSCFVRLPQKRSHGNIESVLTAAG